MAGAAKVPDFLVADPVRIVVPDREGALSYRDARGDRTIAHTMSKRCLWTLFLVPIRLSVSSTNRRIPPGLGRAGRVGGMPPLLFLLHLCKKYIALLVVRGGLSPKWFGGLQLYRVYIGVGRHMKHVCFYVDVLADLGNWPL